MILSKDQILNIFRESNALLEGHFQLSSGLHSANYFQCVKVLQHPYYLSFLAGEIARHFTDIPVDVVVSPAIGGIVVGTEVGRQMGKRTIFAERKDGIMTLRRGFELKEKENVLIVEDVVTTGGSVSEVINVVKKSGAIVSGVGFIVDRSNGKIKFNTNQFSVIQLDVLAYPSDQCPLCRENVPINKPGSKGNY